ncbi:diacylglycerol kinase family protein [Domibacillus sp. DTU_2020_1001157_1_SI_ALB_TIR_016]|uniref:diacylglycerol kinase family protein n=1 Tax=Domibacillus sp. DTU_2020_1001157_1_SI_ALB_TIR_016 TaxID=3077789 RepID=UPI0028EE6410|nr:diacylglycerol kinase family protein [Domibacillus sp. DTU_2020_1001157_1_SI_ALB_TIR_016]WNS82390.1 diacylglycerol kinase family protein [Domibacillus sp. DTU_2020_1001157_1_SI_ALB_TIR_016]
MDLKDKRSFHIKRLFSSFRFAGNGLKLALSEPNMRVHIAAGILISAAGFIFELTRTEWCVMLLTIAGVMSLEMVNTAIEKTVDLVTEEYRPLAKMAKDLAAGAVLLFAIAAVIIGCLLFIPKL